MTTPPKPFVKQQPPTKDQLRQMLAQAVRNTQPQPKPQRPSKGRKDRS